MLASSMLAGVALPAAKLASATGPGAGRPGKGRPGVSPLATPAQSALERLAKLVVASPEVQEAKTAFSQVWLDIAAQAFADIGGPDEYNRSRFSQALEEYAFSCAQKEVNFDPYRPEISALIMPAHRWMGLSVPGGRYVYDNPDTIYRGIPVSGDSAYVISGRVNPRLPTDINITLDADINITEPIANLSIDDLVIDEDGSFVITVSPDQGTGANHIRSTSAARVLFVRDTLGDWEAQTPVSLTVTRTAGPAAPPRRSFSQIAADAAALLTSFGTLAVQTGLGFTTRYPVNTLSPVALPGASTGTLVTQAQSFGHFDLDDEQALVITVDPGGAGYVTVPVTDDWMVTPDYRDHTSSLNSIQAKPNRDGTYTFVLSVRDPGVYNWVDPAGLHQGTLFLRWQRLPSVLPVPGPSATATLVTLSQLAGVLPAGTVTVTRQQRKRQLQERRAGYDRRFASRT